MAGAGDWTPRVLGEDDLQALLDACAETKYPKRNRVVVLLACRAGLSPMEIAQLRRANVLTDNGVLGTTIDLTFKRGVYRRPREIPIRKGGRLWNALLDHLANFPGRPGDPLILPEKEKGRPNPQCMKPNSVTYLFQKIFALAGLRDDGAGPMRKGSAITARTTFIVETGRQARRGRGTLFGVQKLVGVSSVKRIRRIVEADERETRSLVEGLD